MSHPTSANITLSGRLFGRFRFYYDPICLERLTCKPHLNRFVSLLIRKRMHACSMHAGMGKVAEVDP